MFYCILDEIYLNGRFMKHCYSGLTIDLYDPDSGFYYKSITFNVESKGFLGSSASTDQNTNIAIFDPQKGSHKLLFEKTTNREVSFITFESAFERKSIIFSGSSYSDIKNNEGIPKRELKDKLLIGIRVSDQEKTELWTARKDGEDLQKLTEISDDSSWHIDVKNSKIRVMTPDKENQDIQFLQLPW